MQRSAFFSCVQLQILYSSNVSFASSESASHLSGGREKKIEYYFAPRSDSLPSNSISENASRQVDALAACCRHLLHGVWWHLWNGRNHLRRRVWSGNSGSVVLARALVFADGLHDWRAVERAAAGRRLLRVGSPRTRKFFWLSGSVVVAGR